MLNPSTRMEEGISCLLLACLLLAPMQEDLPIHLLCHMTHIHKGRTRYREKAGSSGGWDF